MRGERIKLPQYAGRRSLQVVTASNFNGKLREIGRPRKVTVQKICRLASNEEEVRSILDAFWMNPSISLVRTSFPLDRTSLFGMIYMKHMSLSVKS